jgi:23S rRNA-/tRNA-specific pseudouridylate synthase
VVQLLVVEVEVELLMGRTHQICGQLAAIQCPIVGDVLYGTVGAGAVSSEVEWNCCCLRKDEPADGVWV